MGHFVHFTCYFFACVCGVHMCGVFSLVAFHFPVWGSLSVNPELTDTALV